MQLMSIAGGGSGSNSYTLTYLVVGGGGAGGTYGTGTQATNSGGGGGAGGVVYSSVTVTAGTVFNIFIGAGGLGTTTSTVPGADGGSSVLTSAAVSVTAYGGGGGTTNNNGTYFSSTSTVGSGGGGGARGQNTQSSSAGTTATAGQGNNGGDGAAASGARAAAGAGGGGGAATAGGTGRTISAPTGGAGGNGTSISILTSSITIGAGGGGGGGGLVSNTAVAGGTGGGGTGGFVQTTNPSSQAGGNATYYGGGGGGAVATGSGSAAAGGSGSSGLVILSIPTANFSGTFAGADTSYTVGTNTVVIYSSTSNSSANSGTGSISFAASSFVSSTTQALMSLSQSTFTIEAWIYMTANPTTYNPAAGKYVPPLIGDMQTNAITAGWTFGPLNTGTGNCVGFYWYTTTYNCIFGTTTNMSLNTWYHIAMSVSSNAVSLYVNGVQQTLAGGSTLTSRGSGQTINGWALGTYNTNLSQYFGQVSNLRFVNGTAVYAGASFTPPSSNLTAISGTQLLLNATSNSTVYKDSSTNNFSSTASGTSWSSNSPYSNLATLSYTA